MNHIFEYFYHDAGRLKTVLVDDSAWYDASTQAYAPADRICRIDLEYEPDGNLFSITASADNGAGQTYVADNVFEYDEWRNLAAEVQEHFGYAVPESPRVDYGWTYSPFGSPANGEFNYNRLTSITYPERISDSGRRTLTYYYGATDGDIDSDANRITEIEDSDFDTVAMFAYGGISRRVSMVLGNGINQSLVVPGIADGYGALDGYGRLIDLHYKDANLDTVHRYQYGYDLANNRTFAEVTQATIDQQQHVNDRSYLYYYDGLHRLVESRFGKLNGTRDAIVSDQSVALARNSTWELDRVGNWSGGYVPPPGFSNSFQWSDSFNGGSYQTTRIDHHNVGPANQLEGAEAGGLTDVISDVNGNVVFDGDYFYQYDAWNRLMQVNLAGENLEAYMFDSDGRIVEHTPPYEPGAWQLKFAYDGLGRLILRQAPATGVIGQPVTRTDEYYYDGVRRLQATVHRPSTIPWEREYVYGPEYVDEFLYQVSRNGDAIYMIQDANYNVVATFDDNGTLEQQYQYEPYGEIVAADEGVTIPKVNHVGHQGLFIERMDYPDNAPKFEPGSQAVYYNRNRWYNPRLGRYLQRDPNAAALPILTAAMMNAESAGALLSGFDAMSHYGDGVNLYAYLGSNPVNRLDPMGLDFDDDIDDMINELVGHRLYALGTINEGARVASIGLQTAMEIGKSVIGLDIFESIGKVASGQGGFFDILDVALATIPVAKAAMHFAGTGINVFKAVGKARKFRRLGCNCFVAGTMVDTPDGPMPIEWLQRGDTVLTRNYACPACPEQVGTVTEVFIDESPETLWIVFEDGRTIGTTPGHEVWTHQAGWTSAGELSAGDTFLGHDGTPVTILAVELDPTPVTVYNLEVEGTYTYFVEGVWVHNNSCELLGQLHHIISRKIHNALQRHPHLKGKYQYQDSRFVTRAKDLESHKGYQKWHRNYDDTVVKWLDQKQDAGPAEFEMFLQQL